ncbi:MAG: 16S rRNA (guanine(966)-N(2))-methyltransferase RsmD [Candidatus Saccharibacteria bacterium]|nr:16S rRNA (guanine(966)-N(2))-methyltransferase RsmD [Candidatus Saccharibacteria bacterium]
MQVISGIYKGKNLKSPQSDKTHPMGSREKLALFNMLLPYLENAVVLDAFAGTGALGIEALSRGASGVVFIEKDHKVAKVLRENIANIDDATVVEKSVDSFETDQAFDLIIADPPYSSFKPEQIENLIKFLKPSGVLALSHPGDAPEFTELKLLKSRSYAGATISIYQK